MSQRIFLSHSSKDHDVAKTICLALESRGLQCWLASRDVDPGESFMQAIVRAIRAAKVMVLVFTHNANDSDEIKKELVLASQNRLVIIPVRVEDVIPDDSLAYQFATAQWINLFEDWEHQMERLTARIASIVPIDHPKGETAGPKPLPSASMTEAGTAKSERSVQPQGSAVQVRPNPAWAMARRFFERRAGKISLGLLAALLLVAALWPFVTVTVRSGQVGVLWKKFDCGTVMDPKYLYDEGLHFILPWDELHQYDLRLQSITEAYNSISSDSVSLTVTFNTRFSLDHDTIPLFHQAVGPAYVDSLVKPELGSRTREIIAQHTAAEVYMSRTLVEREIKRAMEDGLSVILQGMEKPKPGGMEKRDRSEESFKPSAGCAPKIPEGSRGNLARTIYLNDVVMLNIERPAAAAK
jgi:regulator of protease activity HflC (stomatin/prohibitin superfamily)